MRETEPSALGENAPTSALLAALVAAGSFGGSLAGLLSLAARELGCEDASVLVRDTSTGGLRFLTAVGDVAPSLEEVKIPSGQGVAGFVFESGQPIAVAGEDAHAGIYRGVDSATGYSTETVLALPLHAEGGMIGVLEFLNKKGAAGVEPFDGDDMDRAAVFAEFLSPLVQSCLLLEGIEEEDALPKDPDSGLSSGRVGISDARDSEAVGLVMLALELYRRGPKERRLCKQVLESILRFGEDADAD